MADFEVQVATHGAIDHSVARYAEEKVARAAEHSRMPVLFARISLREDQNPTLERPAVAKASLDVNGRLVRAHVAAPTLREAVDALEERLRRQLQTMNDERQNRRRRTGDSGRGEWRHGDLPVARPPYFPRPAEEREIVRHKAFDLAVLDPAEAALDLELLDYDFHLFTHAGTGHDTVIYRRSDGSLDLLESSPELSVDEAIEQLDVTGRRFVFFTSPASGRGNVVYHRYDGHYGLITPSDR